MSTDISGIEDETPELPEQENGEGKHEPDGSSPRRGSSALAFSALLLSIAALAGTAWMWWQDQASITHEEKRMLTEISRLDSRENELSLKLNQVRDQLDELTAGDSSAEFEALQKRAQADRLQMDQVEKALAEQMSMGRSLQAAADSLHGRLLAAEAALTGMSTRELDSAHELDLSEVDYLLRLANERLKLFSDPVAADQALEVADMHLASLDNPLYIGVRQDIARARQSLASVEIPDYTAVTSQLDSLQQAVASLPFKGSNAAPEADGQAAGEGWWAKVKGVFSNLVTVRRSTDDDLETISLQDKDLIRQRTWLQLEIAHLAVMRRDQEEFRTSLARLKNSLPEWFDNSDDNYSQVMNSIDKLSGIDLEIEVPDITAPWSTLRQLRSRMPMQAAAPQPETVPGDSEPAVEEEKE